MGACRKGVQAYVFGELGKPVSFIDFKDQELGSLEGNARKATERKVQTIIEMVQKISGVFFNHSVLGGIGSV